MVNSINPIIHDDMLEVNVSLRAGLENTGFNAR